MIILTCIFENWDGGAWNGLVWLQNGNALVNEEKNLRVPQNAGNFLTKRGMVSFSGRTMLHGASVPYILVNNITWNIRGS